MGGGEGRGGATVEDDGGGGEATKGVTLSIVATHILNNNVAKTPISGSMRGLLVMPCGWSRITSRSSWISAAVADSGVRHIDSGVSKYSERKRSRHPSERPQRA